MFVVLTSIPCIGNPQLTSLACLNSFCGALVAAAPDATRAALVEPSQQPSLCIGIVC